MEWERVSIGRLSVGRHYIDTSIHRLAKGFDASQDTAILNDDTAPAEKRKKKRNSFPVFHLYPVEEEEGDEEKGAAGDFSPRLFFLLLLLLSLDSHSHAAVALLILSLPFLSVGFITFPRRTEQDL